MAKRSRARPTSRQSNQSAEQPAPPARTTRATRSRSRESNEQPSIQDAGDGNQAAKKRRGRPAKSAANVGGDLFTVNEEPHESRTVDDNAEDLYKDSPPRRQTSVAATAFTQEEWDQMDPDVMVDFLPRLADAADDLAKLLIPAQLEDQPVLRAEILNPGTKHHKLYISRKDVLQVYKKRFGDSEYIQPAIVIRRLLGVQQVADIPDGPWRPDDVIYAINLALLLDTVLVEMSDELPGRAEAYYHFENLGTYFGSGIVGSTYSEVSFQICLAYLRQLCFVRIAQYADDDTFVPSQQVQETFFVTDPEAGLAFRYHEALHLQTLSNEERRERDNLLQNCASEIIDMVDDQNPQTWMPAVRQLRGQYPWHEFVEEVVAYYGIRKQELDQHIAAVGGMKRLQAALAEEVERRSAAQAAEAKRASLKGVAGKPTKFGSMKSLRAKQKELEAKAAAGLAATASSAAPVAQMTDPALDQQPHLFNDGWQPVQDDEPVPVPAPTSPDTLNRPAAPSLVPALLALQEGQNANAGRGKGKEPSFMNRQPNAQRVTFNDDDEILSQAPPSFQQQGPYYGGAAKRPRPNADDEDEWEPTQDQGFEADTRGLAAAEARRRQAPQPAPRPVFSSSIPGPPSASENDISPRPRKMPRPSEMARPSEAKNPGSSMPRSPRGFDEEQGRPSNTQLMEHARYAARTQTMISSQQRQPQVRNPWTNAEEDAFIQLIEEHGDDGLSWAKLKKLDIAGENRLHRRTAEDMRFKSRNMKVTFLKGVQRLPRNFDKIPLDRKAIVTLQRAGIDYVQDRIRGGPGQDFETVDE